MRFAKRLVSLTPKGYELRGLCVGKSWILEGGRLGTHLIVKGWGLGL